MGIRLRLVPTDPIEVEN